MFTYHRSIKMYETDAAGRLFFAHQFTIAHDAFELFMESTDFSLASLLDKADFLLPIVHAEADYYAPLGVGDKITVTLALEEIKQHSFSLSYQLFDQGGACVGRVKIVHVSVSKESGVKIPLPEELKRSLRSLG